MARRRYTSEEIIQHLRTVELEQGKGLSLELAAQVRRWCLGYTEVDSL